MTTSAQHAERPWHRRSELYDRELEIRALVSEGYSLRQIVQRLGLGVHRSTLHRWLRRVARSASAPSPGVPPAAPGPAESASAAAEDAAAEALLAATDFSPPILPPRK
jgi:transposase